MMPQEGNEPIAEQSIAVVDDGDDIVVQSPPPPAPLGIEQDVEGKKKIFPHFDVLRLNSKTAVLTSNFLISYFS
jgi:hypothetical protein